MPQPAPARAAIRAIFFLAGLAVAPRAVFAAEAEATSDYSTDLGRVYGGYHRIVAEKEACDAAVPASRAANGAAFAAWQKSHQSLVQELRQRVTAMIRLASTDERDYARNLGKYEGAILQEREDYRSQLLKLPAEELRGQCQRMAAVLKGPESDLAKVYANELAAIRKLR
jgi:hypothetical protein